MFGTDGIRARVGAAIINEENLVYLSKAIAQWAAVNIGEKKKLIIGTDTRISGDYIKSFFKNACIAYNIDVYDAGIIPTPVLINVVTKQKKFDLGIIITASHNPYYDNGIKLVTQAGKISDVDEKEIEYIFATKKFKKIDYACLGKEKTATRITKLYTHDVQQNFKPNFLQGLTIVLDCAHGATQKLAPALFKLFGARVHTIANKANGVNINNDCGSTHPAALQKVVAAKQADVGIAFDGDGDRVVFVNKQGVIKDGDDILALLAQHPAYSNQTTIVATIMSNEGLNLHLNQQTKQLIRTNVGDKHVVKRLEDDNLIIGGEPSGHIILQDFINTSDGIFAALKVLESIIAHNNWQLDSFTRMPQIVKNLTIKEPKSLDDEPLASIVREYKKELKNGRIVVRYSGTEPILRIMVETLDQRHAEYLANNLYDELDIYINKGLYEKERNFVRESFK